MAVYADSIQAKVNGTAQAVPLRDSDAQEKIGSLSEEIDEYDKNNRRWIEYVPESYEKKRFSIASMSWVPDENFYTVKVPISKEKQWKSTFRVNANGCGLIYVDEDDVYKHTSPYPFPSETTVYTEYEIPYFSDSAYVYIQSFITEYWGAENFKIYKNSLVDCIQIEKKLSEYDADISHKEDKPNYDANGNFESNFLVYDGTGSFLHFYSDATKIVGCCTPLNKKSLMVSVRVYGDGVGSCAYMDFSDNTIGFGKPKSQWTSDSDLIKITSENIPFTLKIGHPIIIEDVFIATTQTVKFIDAYTLESAVITMDHKSGRDRCGYFNVIGFGGSENIIRNYRKAYMLQPKNPKVLFIGDSYINGYHPYRYATIIKHKLKGNAWLEGISGGDSSDILTHFENRIMSIIKPKYIFWAVGTNDIDYDTWLRNTQKFISDCEEIGSIPVLCTTTITNSQQHNTMAKLANAWIRSSEYKFADLNIITTTNFDGENQNVSMFLSDGVHPTNETFSLMAKKIEADVPEICSI